MAIRQQNRETAASMEYIYKYGDDLYEHISNRKFIVDEDSTSDRQSKIIIGNFIEFMMHTNLVDPNFLKIMISMARSYHKRMAAEDDDSTEEKEKTSEPNPKKNVEEDIQKVLQNEKAFEDFISQFNDADQTFRRKVFEIFIRSMME